MRPGVDEYAFYYGRYIDLVSEEDVVEVLDTLSVEMQKVLSGIDDAQAGFRYEPEKWSIRELVGHVLDTEQIFGFRALAIARGETQPIPGFDEGLYASNSKHDLWRLGDLAESFALARKTHVIFFRNLPEEAWSRRGTVDGNGVTVRALAYKMAGHQRHHLNILRERYLVTQ